MLADTNMSDYIHLWVPLTAFQCRIFIFHKYEYFVNVSTNCICILAHWNISMDFIYHYNIQLDTKYHETVLKTIKTKVFLKVVLLFLVTICVKQSFIVKGPLA